MGKGNNRARPLQGLVPSAIRKWSSTVPSLEGEGLVESVRRSGLARKVAGQVIMAIGAKVRGTRVLMMVMG